MCVLLLFSQMLNDKLDDFYSLLEGIRRRRWKHQLVLFVTRWSVRFTLFCLSFVLCSLMFGSWMISYKRVSAVYCLTEEVVRWCFALWLTKSLKTAKALKQELRKLFHVTSPKWHIPYFSSEKYASFNCDLGEMWFLNWWDGYLLERREGQCSSYAHTNRSTHQSWDSIQLDRPWRMSMGKLSS